MAVKADIQFMQRALELAARARGKTSPNPMVGAVIVRNGKIIAEGYHRRAGEAHAEVIALKKAGSRAAGAAMYVTLEPCCHTGNTGPCTRAIIDSRISRVVCAVRDPDPRVNGKGVARLRRAGIRVSTGMLRREAIRLNEQYLGFHRNKRPYVILKLAQTLDGRIATATGDSRWISSSESRKYAHRLRSEVDAVVVGMGTVRADDPALTVRLVKGTNPYRIVISQSLAFPRSCRLLDDNSDHKTIIASTEEAIERFSHRRKRGSLAFWTIKKDKGGLLNEQDFIEKATAFGLRSLLVEGGAGTATSFIRAGVIDKYVFITAPKVIGKGISAVGDLKIRKLTEAVHFEDWSFERFGGDMVFSGYPRRDGK